MTPPLSVARTIGELRARTHAWRAEGARIALAPTMGALHAGHLSLIARARTQAQRVVASVFVNPRQFAPHEDFDAYPRDEAADAAALAAAGCDLLYAPGPQVIYPPGFATTVDVAGVSEGLDGGARPGHFAGVATVVTKLLLQAQPDVAVFGEKDWQQLAVIRRLVRDLDLEVEVIGAPIVRAADGLALSSRNAYLDAAERGIAPLLNAALHAGARQLAAGVDIAKVETAGREMLSVVGFTRVDYFEVREAHALATPPPGPLTPTTDARLLAAAWLGRTRLIDNVAVWQTPARVASPVAGRRAGLDNDARRSNPAPSAPVTPNERRITLDAAGPPKGLDVDLE